MFGSLIGNPLELGWSLDLVAQYYYAGSIIAKLLKAVQTSHLTIS